MISGVSLEELNKYHGGFIMENNIIYWGVFFTPEELAANGFSGRLPKRILCPHITFEFRPKVMPEDFLSLLGKPVDIIVTGYACNDDNEGLEIEIPQWLKKWYRGANIPHITVSVSQTGKPVNTANLNFVRLPYTTTLHGRIGFFPAGGTDVRFS